MGWSGGSEIIAALSESLSRLGIGDNDRCCIYTDMVRIVLDRDCDTLDECRGLDEELDYVIDDMWGVGD